MKYRIEFSEHVTTEKWGVRNIGWKDSEHEFESKVDLILFLEEKLETLGKAKFELKKVIEYVEKELDPEAVLSNVTAISSWCIETVNCMYHQYFGSYEETMKHLLKIGISEIDNVISITSPDGVNLTESMKEQAKFKLKSILEGKDGFV